ncbi:hypothetical protein [Clostridium sp. AM58-1XD]|uniref:hypothetical protein n=1 Tax=Clostridium sp. AM58-1XD TaxID=2292307 RepID=UPI000E55610F|nr:hypothetical protein [Clostridium sp. AM58-1XD]RGY94407.1 hypothetical protein DXA13_20605 [Clostridium sp. AM58-1XD]
MKKKWIIICSLILFVSLIIVYTGIQRTHTFTLTEINGTSLKEEQIQPIFGIVKVSGNCDTDVVFTDVETGVTYTIGYITSGVSEKIRLQRGKWYTVNGAGNLTINPVNLRIE